MNSYVNWVEFSWNDSLFAYALKPKLKGVASFSGGLVLVFYTLGSYFISIGIKVKYSVSVRVNML